jgi:hypothetical protein
MARPAHITAYSLANNEIAQIRAVLESIKWAAEISKTKLPLPCAHELVQLELCGAQTCVTTESCRVLLQTIIPR